MKLLLSRLSARDHVVHCSLATGQLLPYATALDLTQYLGSEMSIAPWYAALTDGKHILIVKF